MVLMIAFISVKQIYCNYIDVSDRLRVLEHSDDHFQTYSQLSNSKEKLKIEKSISKIL